MHGDARHIQWLLSPNGCRQGSCFACERHAKRINELASRLEGAERADRNQFIVLLINRQNPDPVEFVILPQVIVDSFAHLVDVGGFVDQPAEFVEPLHFRLGSFQFAVDPVQPGSHRPGQEKGSHVSEEHQRRTRKGRGWGF